MSPTSNAVDKACEPRTHVLVGFQSDHCLDPFRCCVGQLELHKCLFQYEKRGPRFSWIVRWMTLSSEELWSSLLSWVAKISDHNSLTEGRRME